MRLQLFQLTRKCGHLHGRGGTGRRGRRASGCTPPPRPVTLLLSATRSGKVPRHLRVPLHRPGPTPAPHSCPAPLPPKNKSRVSSFLLPLQEAGFPFPAPLTTSSLVSAPLYFLDVHTSPQTCRASLRKAGGRRGARRRRSSYCHRGGPGCRVRNSHRHRGANLPARGDAGPARVTGRGGDHPPGFPLLEPNSQLRPGRGMRQSWFWGPWKAEGPACQGSTDGTADLAPRPCRVWCGANHPLGLPGVSLGPAAKLEPCTRCPSAPLPRGWQGRPSGGGSGPCLLSRHLRAAAQPSRNGWPAAPPVRCGPNTCRASFAAPPTTLWAGRALRHSHCTDEATESEAASPAKISPATELHFRAMRFRRISAGRGACALQSSQVQPPGTARHAYTPRPRPALIPTRTANVHFQETTLAKWEAPGTPSPSLPV